MESKQKDTAKLGRPVKEKEKLSCAINLKLTEEDYKSLKEKAESIGMKVTQYAREMTLNGRIKSRYTKEELNLRRKIAGLANNLNQIARKANIEGYEKAASEAEYLLSYIKYLLGDR